jgi:N-acetylglucosaminyldiphosphoundecaprenol N-acetyl-beta-D-mannosaminyltransferase
LIDKKQRDDTQLPETHHTKSPCRLISTPAEGEFACNSWNENNYFEADPLPRIDVIGSKISVCDTGTALQLLEQRIASGNGGYVCFTNVHAVVMGHREPDFQRITGESLLSVADGKPVYWVAKAKGAQGAGHVPGPDFMLQAIRRFPGAGHFFYGSTPPVLEALVQSLARQIPGLKVCGTFSPPFRPLTEDEQESVVGDIRASRASFVWVGLGAPKQERWIAENWQALKPAVLLGVGAAFDFHAGTLQRAPARLRDVGLEWLYRLLQEPSRLWRRYLVTNTLFIYYLIRRRLGFQ